MKKTILSIAIIGSISVACSTDDTIVSGNGFSETEVKVFAEINEPVSAKAGITEANFNGFVLKIDNPVNPAHSYDTEMVRVDGLWMPAEGLVMMWDTDATPVTVTAFAPAVEEVDGLLGISAKSNQSDEANLNASDFIMVKRVVNPAADLEADGTLKLSFDHMMSRLVISVKVGSESADISKISNLALNGLVLDGVCNLSDSAPSVEPAEGATASTLVPFKTESGFECIVLPQTLSPETFSLNFVYDGKAYVWSPEEAGELFKSTSYSLELYIGAVPAAAASRLSGTIHAIK